MRARPFVFQMLSLLPAALSSAIGAGIAPIIAPRQMPVRHKRAGANLEVLCPFLDAREREGILRRRWSNLGRFLFELPVLKKLDPPKFIEENSDFRHAMNDPKPLVIVSMHIGNWELLGWYLFNRSGRTGVGIYQQRADPAQSALLAKARGTSMSAAVSPGSGAARQAIRALLSVERSAVLLLLDERRDGQVWFPLFGRKIPPSGNLLTALRLARIAEANILPVFLERVEGTRFRVQSHPILSIDDLGEVELVRKLDKWFGAAAIKYSDQWLALQDMDAKLDYGFQPAQSLE